MQDVRTCITVIRRVVDCYCWDRRSDKFKTNLIHFSCWQRGAFDSITSDCWPQTAQLTWSSQLCSWHTRWGFQSQCQINHFWNRWRTEYLNELRECHRHTAGRTSQPVHVAVGEVVVVRDDTLPRSFWKLGRIQDVITGRDGVIRGAAVKVASRDRQFTLLWRPIQHLYPLEIKV